MLLRSVSISALVFYRVKHSTVIFLSKFCSHVASLGNLLGPGKLSGFYLSGMTFPVWA